MSAAHEGAKDNEPMAEQRNDGHLKIEMTVESHEQARRHLDALLDMIPQEAPEYHAGCYTSDYGGSSFGRWITDNNEPVTGPRDKAGLADPDRTPQITGPSRAAAKGPREFALLACILEEL